MQAAKAAIAHHEYLISRTQSPNEIRTERVQVAAQVATLAERCDDRLHVPAQIGRRVDPYLVSRGERRRQRIPMHAHAHGLRARLEHGDDARTVDALTQAGERRLDRRRMMGEIIIDDYAGYFSAHLHATRDSLEGAQRLDPLGHGNPRMARGCEGGKRVVDVVSADERPLHPTVQRCALEDIKRRPVGHTGREAARPQRTGCARPARETLARRPASHGESLF